MTTGATERPAARRRSIRCCPTPAKTLDWLRANHGRAALYRPAVRDGPLHGPPFSAFELATAEAERIDGVIIESGRPNLGRFTVGLDAATAQALEDAYHAKVYSIRIPTLVIHGQMDETAPIADAIAMHDNIQAVDKHLVIIPAAGHNDLMYVGFRQYFEAIRRFIVRYAG